MVLRTAIRAGVLVVVVVAVMTPGAVAASCAGEPRELVRQSQIAFVGTVTAVRDGYARFDVDSVARGPDLAPVVWVQGGQQQPPFPISLLFGVGSSVDVDWSVGSRYAVGAYNEFRTNECLVYQSGPATVAGVEVAKHRLPVSDGLQGANTPPTTTQQALAVIIGITVTVAIAVVAKSAVRWRRSSNPGSHPRRVE